MPLERMETHPRFLLALLAALTLAPATAAQRVSLGQAGVGGQSGRPPGNPRDLPGGLERPGGLNEGGLSVDDFDYVPDKPADFQPFDCDDVSLSERGEFAVTVPNAAQFPGTGWIQEDPEGGLNEITGTRNLFGASANIRAIASGNLDADPAAELVAVEIGAGRDRLHVLLADRAPDGTYHVTQLVEVPAEAWDYLDADVELGDVDGDGRNELLVVGRSRVFGDYGDRARLRVFDDPADGLGELGTFYRGLGHADMRAFPGDLDGDGRDEVVIYLQGDTTTNRMAVTVLADSAGGFAVLRGWTYLGNSYSKVALGDYDGDGIDEIGVVDQASHSGPDVVKIYDFNAQNLHVLATSTTVASQNGTENHEWDLAAVDRDADGVDELALLGHSGNYRLYCLAWNALGGQWDVDSHDLGIPGGYMYAGRLATGDTDADRHEELYIGITTTDSSQSKTLRVGHIDWDDPQAEPAVVLQAPQIVGGSGDTVPASIVAADVDGDGLYLQYVRKFLVVADPIPLVLMHAPPTKAGIDQNYGESGTSYSVATSSSETIGVTNAITASISAGYEVEDLTGMFGASVKATVETAFERAEIETTRTTFVQGFAGAYGDDVIIFQATLYRSYEYLVVGAPDPALVGTYMTLDRPVDVNIYKWTVDFYNANVANQDRLAASLTPHTIGNPATYRNRVEQANHVAELVSWASDEVTLGQTSGGTNFVRIEFEQENTTEEQRTLGAGIESEFKAGGASVGASIGISQTDLYAISISESTEYEGVVGDVGDHQDYDDYLYNFGLTVHQHGVNADAENLPTSLDPGVQPFLIVSYWTHLTGSEYEPEG